MPEVSRSVTLAARQEGVEHLFLEDPLLFSRRLLEGRIAQFKATTRVDGKVVFLDRGIPDVLAYMHYAGTDDPEEFATACREYCYDLIFILKPWKGIYKSDTERYENFEQAQEIHRSLVNTYTEYNYALTDVPYGSVADRADFILDVLNLSP